MRLALKLGIVHCTSQSSGEEDMGPIFLDYTLCNRLEGWSPPQLANGVYEVRVKGQSEATAATEMIPFLHSQTVDLPSTKLPRNTDNGSLHWCPLLLF